jgi:hypothetical protein
MERIEDTATVITLTRLLGGIIMLTGHPGWCFITEGWYRAREARINETFSYTCMYDLLLKPQDFQNTLI